jgi:hypothetical protein
MERYRNTKTGTMVEAVQLTEDNVDDIRMLVMGAVRVTEIEEINRNELPALNIPTPSGMMRASIGQYIVKVGGRFYVALPGLFRQSYVPVEVPPGPVPKDVRDSKILRDRTDDV